MEPLNSTAVHVSWKLPVPSKQHGQIRGYQVTYVRLENGEPRGPPVIQDVMLAEAQVCCGVVVGGTVFRERCALLLLWIPSLPSEVLWLSFLILIPEMPCSAGGRGTRICRREPGSRDVFFPFWITRLGLAQALSAPSVLVADLLGVSAAGFCLHRPLAPYHALHAPASWFVGSMFTEETGLALCNVLFSQVVLC